MLKAVSFLTTQPGTKQSLLQQAARSFGFWDMSKSKAKNDPELLKTIALHQSPINISTKEAVYDKDFQIDFQYNQINVDTD